MWVGDSMVKTHKNKRYLWVAIAGAVLLLSIGGYFLIKELTAPQVVSENLDSVPDYGACELVTTESIRGARLANQIVQLNEGVRTKADGLNGTAADSCTFTFLTNTSTNNSLTVSAYPYSDSQEAFDKEQKTAEWLEVSGPKPTPYFGKTTIDNGKTSLYMLRVLPGAKTILLSLRQPVDAPLFEQPDAVNFLVDISKKINFGALERNAAQQADSVTEGDGPGAPPANQPVEQAKPRQQ